MYLKPRGLQAELLSLGKFFLTPIKRNGKPSPMKPTPKTAPLMNKAGAIRGKGKPPASWPTKVTRSPSLIAQEMEAVVPQTQKDYYYLSGPMTGYPDFNFRAFEQACQNLRARGETIVSPHELDDPAEVAKLDPMNPAYAGSQNWAMFLGRDVEVVADPRCIGVICLPEWEQSKGARLEVHVARELGKPIYKYVVTGKLPFLPKEEREPQNILERANQLVGGDRGEDYGHPYHDFSRTAKIMSAILDTPVTPNQVALCMIAVKISRLCNTPDHLDSVTDVAGYARTLEMVINFDAELKRAAEEEGINNEA